jgi:hypothetical protein
LRPDYGHGTLMSSARAFGDGGQPGRHLWAARANVKRRSLRPAGTYAVSDRSSSLQATENEVERAAADWLAQIASGPLSPQRNAEFEQ